MGYKSLFIFILLCSLACHNNAGSSARSEITVTSPGENPFGSIKDIPLPAGFERTACTENSFAYFLRNTKLKKDKTVYLYNGQPKINQSAQFAVLNIRVGSKDLQQCADAVMRLRAEFLFSQKEFDRILFYDNAKTAYKFSPPYTRDHFPAYLERVFGMCGTASLARQLNRVESFSQVMPGDVIIRGGFPGHAVMVMDAAINKSGQKIYLLAQGYMPAQDIHVLINPASENLSPWYAVSESRLIETPEYRFTKEELRRW